MTGLTYADDRASSEVGRRAGSTGLAVLLPALLLLAGPGLARAGGCTGITSGDFTFYSCDDGTSFTEQRIGDLRLITGDLQGFGQRIGNVELLDIERMPEPIGWGTTPAPAVEPLTLPALSPVGLEPLGVEPVEPYGLDSPAWEYDAYDWE